MPGEIGGVLYIALVLSGLVLLVCWIVLPFALIGTKPLLRDLLREQRRTNLLLEQLATPRTAATAHGAAAIPDPDAPKPYLIDRIADAVERRFPGGV